MAQPLIWAERCRGRGLVWTPDANWFINDPLDPEPHSHDDATEILFMAQGSMEILVGGSKRVYHAGDLILMPPDKFHNYWFKGDETVCLFVGVAPNHKYHRRRIKNFRPGAHEGDAPYANAFETDQLPSDQHFQSERITLNPGQSEGAKVYDLQERIVYILSGTATLKLGTLSGALAPHQYQHIPATTRHEMSNSGFEPLVYMSFVITDPYTAQGTAPHDDE
jgi:quercetin dioxygenase-like cupin family protein